MIMVITFTDDKEIQKTGESRVCYTCRAINKHHFDEIKLNKIHLDDAMISTY